jgi:hypothetical protein
MKPAAGFSLVKTMDIVTHAITGAVTGQIFGRPILGASVAILPDISLGVARKLHPPEEYDMMHAPVVMLFCIFAWCGLFVGILGLSVDIVKVCMLAYLSHIVLDVQTHGDEWAPMLFAPMSMRRVSLGGEWEFFNRYWCLGMITAILWNLICLFFIVT